MTAGKWYTGNDRDDKDSKISVTSYSKIKEACVYEQAALSYTAYMALHAVTRHLKFVMEVVDKKTCVEINKKI